MKYIYTLAACSLLLLQACGQGSASTSIEKKIERKVPQLPAIQKNYVLSDYLSENESLTKDVDALFASLDDTAIVAQLIMPAVGRLGQTKSTIEKHIKFLTTLSYYERVREDLENLDLDISDIESIEINPNEAVIDNTVEEE